MLRVDNYGKVKISKGGIKLNNLITTKELAKLLGLSTETIYRYRVEGMPCKRFSARVIRYDLDEVMKWFEERGK